MAMTVARLLGILAVATSCSGKVTASDSRIVETFEVAGATIKIKSSFEAGISKGTSSGKWGLGSSSPGGPFARHITELVIETDRKKKSVYLCGRYWGAGDFPGLEDKALLAKLEEVGADSFRQRRPELERCVDETSSSWTLLLARCRIDPGTSFEGWYLISIGRDREQGIVSRALAGVGSSSCDELLAEKARGR